MKNYAERLHFAMDRSGNTPALLAEGLGLSRQAINRVFRENGAGLGAAASAKAARMCSVSIYWLATGEGSPDDSDDFERDRSRSDLANDVANWLDALEDRQARLLAYHINHQMLVLGRWPELPSSPAQAGKPAQTAAPTREHHAPK